MRDVWRTRAFLTICVLLLGYGVVEWLSNRAVAQPAGVLAAALPQQTPLPRPLTFERNGHALKALARYEITARVLSKEHYRWDRGAVLAPTDLAVGWGPMSDSAVLNKLEITQDNRWYNWRAQSFPIPRDEINRHAANMHLIASSREIEKSIRKVRPGRVVTMRGFLVEASGPNGYKWTSSLSREDSGDGACELMWVESFEEN
jgi:hypothetical protein